MVEYLVLSYRKKLRLLTLNVQHKCIRSSKFNNNASTTGTMTNVCSQMASWEQELNGVKVYHMTHCSSHLLFPFLPTTFMGHISSKSVQIQHADTKRDWLIHVFIQGKDLSQCDLASSYKNNTGWVRGKEMRFCLPLGLLVNALHHQRGMMTEPQTNERGDPRRNCSHQFLSHLSNIFVWCDQPSENSEREWVIQWSLGYEEQKSVETHGWEGYDGGDVSFPLSSIWSWCVSSCSFMFVSEWMLLGMLKWVHT